MHPCPLHYTNVRRPVALLIPCVDFYTRDTYYVWETPSEQTLTMHRTREDALAHPPYGYRLLDDAWQPIHTTR